MVVTGGDERLSLARGSAVRYGAIPAESPNSDARKHVVWQRLRWLRTAGGVVVMACITFLAFCQLFTNVSAVQVVSSVGTVGMGYVRYHHAVAKQRLRFSGGIPASTSNFNEFGDMLGNESAALGGCRGVAAGCRGERERAAARELAGAERA